MLAQASFHSAPNNPSNSSINSSSPNSSFSASNSPTLNSNTTNASNTAAVILNNSNTQMNASSITNDDHNPFDVAENKDYFKSQDVEIKQLIINVIRWQKKIYFECFKIFNINLTTIRIR